MEYEEMVNFLDKKLNQPSKFRTENWVEINDNVRGTYNLNSQVKFKAVKVKFMWLEWCIYTS